MTSRVEFDPLGADISLTEPPELPPGENEGEIGAGHFGSIMDQRWTDFFNLNSGFTVGGFSISSSEAAFYLNFGTGQSSLNNIGVSPKAVADALGAVFAGVGAGSVNIRVSGVEGTPGHQTIENAWTYAEGYGWYYGPTATAYSGVTATAGSVVSLASNISLRAVQPQNPTVPLGDLRKGLQDLLKKRDCADYVQKLLNQASKMFAGPYPHINTFWEGYNKISGAGGGGYQLDRVASNGGTVSGDLFANGALPGTVHITPYGTIGRAAGLQEAAGAQARYAYEALHETLHLGKIGWYSDEELARAAYKLAGQQAPNFGKGDTLKWSGRVDDFLSQHCPNK